MVFYSAALLAGLVIGSPWWLLRMATTSRYREGLWQRLGGVPSLLLEVVRGRRVVWVHAVSVGEVLAASRLVVELEAALQAHISEARCGAPAPAAEWVVVVSTTTRTGQALARERFGAERVFYFPLDFAWAVRAYLRALRPTMLVLMESELWPRMLHECRRAGVPVAVVNARVSDRSFARGMKVRSVWGRALRRVSLWLAQSEEDARRLVAMGATPESVQVSGNLKFDVTAAKESRVAELIKHAAGGRPIVVAGSTVGAVVKSDPDEEVLVLDSWDEKMRTDCDPFWVLAPRHPERFAKVESLADHFCFSSASEWLSDERSIPSEEAKIDLVLLDTIGDLAAVYGVADVAFVGGSLVDRGGHNPLEPAQFGVPVVMGPHFQNFRGIVGAMQASDGICIVSDTVELRDTLQELLQDRERARAIGQRGRQVFEAQQGATARTVAALKALSLQARVRGE